MVVVVVVVVVVVAVIVVGGGGGGRKHLYTNCSHYSNFCQKWVSKLRFRFGFLRYCPVPPAACAQPSRLLLLPLPLPLPRPRVSTAPVAQNPGRTPPFAYPTCHRRTARGCPQAECSWFREIRVEESHEAQGYSGIEEESAVLGEGGGECERSCSSRSLQSSWRWW